MHEEEGRKEKGKGGGGGGGGRGVGEEDKERGGGQNLGDVVWLQEVVLGVRGVKGARGVGDGGHGLQEESQGDRRLRGWEMKKRRCCRKTRKEVGGGEERTMWDQDITRGDEERGGRNRAKREGGGWE